MVLQELKFKSNPFCVCKYCSGRGLKYKVGLPFDFGIICNNCGGTGFNIKVIDNSVKLYIDEVTRTIYEVINGEINDIVNLFEERKMCNRFGYVMYESVADNFKPVKPMTKDDYYDLGVPETCIISYEDFSNGEMPTLIDGGKLAIKSFDSEVNNYEITDNKIFVNRLHVGEMFKCDCEYCLGTGILESDIKNIGIICDECNGSGYEYRVMRKKYYVAKNLYTGTLYYVIKGVIKHKANPFIALKETKGIDYVMYKNFALSYYKDSLISAKDFFKIGIAHDELISYQKFFNGRLPLPMKKYDCPYHISDDPIDDECANNNWFNGYNHCSKFGTEECWDKFYGNNITTEEKQKVLRKYRKLRELSTHY